MATQQKSDPGKNGDKATNGKFGGDRTSNGQESLSDEHMNDANGDTVFGDGDEMPKRRKAVPRTPIAYSAEFY